MIVLCKLDGFVWLHVFSTLLIHFHSLLLSIIFCIFFFNFVISCMILLPLRQNNISFSNWTLLTSLCGVLVMYSLWILGYARMGSDEHPLFLTRFVSAKVTSLYLLPVRKSCVFEYLNSVLLMSRCTPNWLTYTITWIYFAVTVITLPKVHVEKSKFLNVLKYHNLYYILFDYGSFFFICS